MHGLILWSGAATAFTYLLTFFMKFGIDVQHMCQLSDIKVKVQTQNRPTENIPLVIVQPWFNIIFTKFGNATEVLVPWNMTKFKMAARRRFTLFEWFLVVFLLLF